ncbi:hypothetical protein EI555_006316 [Monodon monoceros]|uniref:Ferritin light chain n=1 Tax=Monodon monoceros TaxID=40151 RepID=A0A4U1EGW8_MONMO|nr:hypothetical protein EI555_006316 [Monodon monoceros]
MFSAFVEEPDTMIGPAGDPLREKLFAKVSIHFLFPKIAQTTEAIQRLDRTGTPLLPASDHPVTSFLVTASRTTFSAVLGLQGQPALGFVWCSGGPGPRLLRVGRGEKLEGAQRLLKMQNQCRGCSLYWDMPKPSQDEWGKALDTREATVALEKNLNQAVWGLHALSSACTCPQLFGFLENCSGSYYKKVPASDLPASASPRQPLFYCVETQGVEKEEVDSPTDNRATGSNQFQENMPELDTDTTFCVFPIITIIITALAITTKSTFTVLEKQSKDILRKLGMREIMRHWDVGFKMILDKAEGESRDSVMAGWHM